MKAVHQWMPTRLKDSDERRGELVEILQRCFFVEAESTMRDRADDVCSRPTRTYSPPKSCMPSSAKIRMNKKSRKSKLTMDRILLSSDTTKLRNDAQCLAIKTNMMTEKINGDSSRQTIRLLNAHSIESVLSFLLH